MYKCMYAYKNVAQNFEFLETHSRATNNKATLLQRIKRVEWLVRFREEAPLRSVQDFVIELTEESRSARHRERERVGRDKAELYAFFSD